MHDAFDTAMYEFDQNLTLPFTQESWDQFSHSAQVLMGKFETDSLFNLTEKDTSKWVVESYWWGTITAFNSELIAENEPVPADIAAGFKGLLERRIVSAGYRLAIMLQDIYADPKAQEKVAETSGELLFLQE